MIDLTEGNNQIIVDWTGTFVFAINAQKRALGIRHNRTQPAILSKSKFYNDKGEINRIGIKMSKGEIFTHKGVGNPNSPNRVAKPWFNPVAEEKLPELADSIAANTGDTIAANLCIL